MHPILQEAANFIAKADEQHELAAALSKITARFTEKAALLETLDFNDFGGVLHEKSHCARVLLLALLEGALEGLDDASLEALAFAAVFHDSRRENDDIDTGHGMRAKVYYEAWSRYHEQKIMPEASIALAFHDLPDMIGMGAAQAHHEAGTASSEAADVLRTFKDADALDRYRFGCYGLDPNYLRLPSATALMPLARALNGL